MVKRTFSADNTVLHLPVTDTEDMWYIKVSCDNKQIAEFYIALTDVNPDFYCPLYIDGQGSHEIVLSCDDGGAPDSLLSGIIEGGTIESRTELYPDIYSEKNRQLVHFSSKRGWLNDPNGLVFTDDGFHMCYQHNPFGSKHGGVNISWGLAVSTDLVHFREYPDAIRPSDSLTHIASGSAIVDEYNISGHGKGTVLAAYTALESKMYKGRKSVGTRGQILEYSTDGGYHFKRITERPIIPVPAGEAWRDPKILRIDEHSLCIAVYETSNEKNCVSFYSSEDCRHWRFESRTGDLCECPDLFCLPVAETGERLWVLYGGNGVYRIGNFSDYKFNVIDIGGHMDYGPFAYAGQTWNSHPDDSLRYHIAWMRSANCCDYYEAGKSRKEAAAFSQSMTVACELKLHKTSLGYRLFRKPVEEFKKLRKDGSRKTILLEAGRGLPLPVPGDSELTLSAASDFSLRVGTAGFDWQAEALMASFTGANSYRFSKADKLELRIITDRISVEFYLNGEISATYYSPDAEKTLVSGSGAECISWELNSIWS